MADAPDMGGWVLMDWHRCKERGKGFPLGGLLLLYLGGSRWVCIWNKYVIILAWSQEPWKLGDSLLFINRP